MTLRIAAAVAGLLVLTGVTHPANSQSLDLEASRLALGTDSLDIFLVRGAEQRRVGRVWDELQRLDRNGVPSLRRIYRTENAAFGSSLDSTYSRWADLKPMAHKSEGRQAVVEVLYRTDSILGRRSLGGGSPRSIARVGDAALYDGSSFDVMIRAAPLREGYRIEVRAYLTTQDSVVTLAARVTGAERLQHPSGEPPLDVWVVDMDFAGLASTLWIDKRTHALVRQVIKLTPDIPMLMTRPGVALQDG